MIALAAGPAFGQNYPVRAVRVVVPFAAGGGTDIVARTVAAALGERLGQNFLVDNRPGAAGAIGAELAARSAPDGYTLLVGSSGPMVPNPLLNPELS
jgi:tripartite-type tricarboxylate transporter receptor subunit TctC